MKGYMQLLKNSVPFYWDEATQLSFDALKKDLVSTLLISPPNYNRYFLLYFLVAESLIGMVLVQEYDELQENNIYYVSHVFLGHEIKYSHVDKLALEAFHVVQCLCNYIILQKTTIATIVNKFEYVFP
jgi:hypothetical protein